MKKFLVHLLCCFIPCRKLRRRVRNRFLPKPAPLPVVDIRDVHGINNIGGGKWRMPGWINADLYVPDELADIKIDLLKQQKLPIASNFLRVAFCSHLIEHLTDDNGINLFKEVFRILGDGGVFRVSCPSADKAFTAYSKGDTGCFFNVPLSGILPSAVWSTFLPRSNAKITRVLMITSEVRLWITKRSNRHSKAKVRMNLSNGARI
jgi:SAM-dependent methyltransferase